MSLQPQPIGPIPEETARVARAAFPKGNVYMQMRDALGTVYDDASFAALFATRGRPAEAPWRLALVTVRQFAEGLSDRQAAEAVRGRSDWKYALGLELTDPGFDFSVLSEFRQRLVAGAAEHLVLDRLLTACRARGLLRARGRQRTDSTHVLGALRVVNRLEAVAETLRSALNAIAAVAPEWLRAWVPAEWFERYDRRVEDARLPKGQAARQTYAETVGGDGWRLLTALWEPTAPPALRELPAADLLRRTWIQHYVILDGRIRLRDPKDMPPAAQQIESPYESEARFSTKRGLHWVGYKVHLTESCDDDLPHLVTQVKTTIAPEPDGEQLAAIQAGLARSALLPGQHLVDAGYVRGQNLVASRAQHQIDLVGPIADDHQWQAQAGEGFDLAHFRVDWEARVVHCPRGRPSGRWCATQTARDRTMIHIDCAPADCTPCPDRARCTRAKTQPRSLTLQVRAEHEAIQAARARPATPEFAAAYAPRAGVEGSLSQGVRVCGLRRARYRGLRKTHLQHVATAAAVNISRLHNWLAGASRAKTRCSRFAALDPTKTTRPASAG
ncbi:MAG TPA: IS1182 family transposase [Dehalococcoidia bacterium]|nr:IS1182 family transposase [Dehalococcoidia bacterium]